jgi:uncharacterized membrane protein (UPF0127 family)
MFGSKKKLHISFISYDELKPLFFLLIFPALFLIFISAMPGEKKFVQVFFPDGFSVTAELAITDEERQLGFMFRTEINQDQGMLFIFEEEGYHSFWMKNMNFPLDILWLDKDKRIIHLESCVPPCQRTPCPSYAPLLPALYVLELKAGSIEKKGLKLYDRLDFILPDGLMRQ